MPWRDAGLRQLARAALRVAPRVRSPYWLRAPWRDRLAERVRSAHDAFATWPDPAHAAYNFGPTSALDAAYEGHYADRHGLRLLHPYRDWPFLRFALSLPAHMSVREGMTKWIGRQALVGRLPDEWRLRPKQGDLLPQLSRLCTGQAGRSFEDAIEVGRPIWERFVDPGGVALRLRRAGTVPARDELLLVLAGFGKWSLLASTPERH